MSVTSFYVTEEPGADPAKVNICTFEININYEVIPTIICSVCFTLGFIYCFFGYRCFRVVMFFSGFMSSSAAMFLLYHNEPTLNALGMETKAGIGLGVGVLCGLMSTLVSAIGLLLSGLQLGLLLSLAILVVIGHFHSLMPVWLPVAATLAASITIAVFTLQWQRLFTIIYTSVFGATVVMLCMDYLLGMFVLLDQVYDVLCEVVPHPLCWFNWAITGIWPVMSLLGVLVQWRFTANGISHRAMHRKQKKYAEKLTNRESRRRPQTHRRRRPPPLRRYTGDVLAPSYLQRLQERQMGTGSSTCSISTATHTLIDFDYETGSMVPLTAASPVCTV
ncbi:transmembrane protein 198-like [Antennarius striatus]|uniref:transmembrane protein 198-like n=1 Tax=Antennarius striatus TaxID=241820 RepID=UPI0035B3DC26